MTISRPADPVLIPSLFVALLLVASSTAAQGLPDPRNSTTDLVVGSASGNLIGGSSPGFDVVVRDVNSAPMPGRVITLDFSALAMRVFAVQNAGATVDCAAKTVSRMTNTWARSTSGPASRATTTRTRSGCSTTGTCDRP